ncbi:hypothetical_protein (plasmid) [Leishmania braziliensis MHOM/BR/75/M2904]|uniref:Hypothetical_protein n=1 Tax=Leishmania braziliensis MHOM/BR/75/M2904 TaxID=420245 RepID=A0A3P3Z1W0_LEIBR|nr:unnamed protein product [Leishmania braziliensis]CAJ2469325.1 unnamed protein product [Leishmania braziliensis]SYZ64182.1 hypothetical_protein [Leishmania braziliensis MHOM/BR/75/M2904]SYZ64184.1 hypothetical_protein [Leishmania braziliensis MHOM/BR/75/M2904]
MRASTSASGVPLTEGSESRPAWSAASDASMASFPTASVTSRAHIGYRFSTAARACAASSSAFASSSTSSCTRAAAAASAARTAARSGFGCSASAAHSCSSCASNGSSVSASDDSIAPSGAAATVGYLARSSASATSFASATSVARLFRCASTVVSSAAFSTGRSFSARRRSISCAYSGSRGRPSSRSGTPRTSLCGRNGLRARTSSSAVSRRPSSLLLASASWRARSWARVSTACSFAAFVRGLPSSGARCATSAWNSSSCTSGSSLSGTPATRFDRNG